MEKARKNAAYLKNDKTWSTPLLAGFATTCWMFQLHFTGVYNWNGHLPSSESVGPYKLCGVRWPFSTPNLAAATLKFWPLASSAPSAAVEKPRQNEAEWGPPLTNNVCLRAYALQNLAKPRTHHSGDNQKNWVSSSKGESMSFWPKSGDKSCWLQYQLHVYVYVYIYICVCVCVI